MTIPPFDEKDIIERATDEEETSEKPQTPRPKGFRAAWGHAFSMKVADDEFNPDDIKLIDEVASEVIKRRMSVPVLLFLESVKPLSFLTSQSLYFLRPFLIAATRGNVQKYERFALLMEKTEGMQRFIESIERQHDKRIKESKAKKDDNP